jgi:hypothetical protein
MAFGVPQETAGQWLLHHDAMAIQTEQRPTLQEHPMFTAARIGSASLFAIIAALSTSPASAIEAAQNPDPELCAEYLKDLNAYRRMAVLLGCKLPDGDAAAASAQAPTQVATAESEAPSFPPVITDEPAAPAQEFPPVAEETTAAETNFPPVEQASTDPAPTQSPPVVSESSEGSGSSGGSNPPVVLSSSGMPDESFEDPTDPASEVRAAIEEKLAILKEEAKERVKEAIILKAEEVKERVKEKIKQKIEEAIEHHNGNAATPATTFRRAAETGLRRAAKDAVKRIVSEHRNHGGGGLLSKLSQLRHR